MTFLAIARRLDSEDRPVEAADAYEEALRCSEEGVSMDTYVDLAVLYFVCNDGGYAAHHHLPRSFLERAWNRMFQLPAAAEMKFGKNPELAFWPRYFEYFWLNGEPFTEECIAMVADGRTLVPYFYLYAFTDTEDVTAHTIELRRQVELGQTAKARYIRSVLDAAFEQRSPGIRE